MTSLVGIYCSDGIVIGADSVTTVGGHVEAPTHKVKMLDGQPVIYAGAGNVAYIQRLGAALGRTWSSPDKSNCRQSLDVGKLISRNFTLELEETYVSPVRERSNPLFPDVAMAIGFTHGRNHCLCAIEAGTLQPFLLDETLWYYSQGNNAHITNTFLSFVRDVFWQNGPPEVSEGIFAAVWTLRHVIATNIGGVGGKMSIAVIERNKSKQWDARILPDETIETHEQAVDDAKIQLKNFLTERKQLWLGQSIPTIPKPASATAAPSLAVASSIKT